jgi:hypothetical protein
MLTTKVELLMLALDVLVEAEQLVSSTGEGVVLLVVAVLPVELVCVYGRRPYFFKGRQDSFVTINGLWWSRCVETISVLMTQKP